MNRRAAALALLALGALGVPLVALGQHKKTWRVGFFMSRGGDVKTSEKAFLAGMREHGYEVGRNLIIDVRYAEGGSFPRRAGWPC